MKRLPKFRQLRMVFAIFDALMFALLISSCATAQTSSISSNPSVSNSSSELVITKDSFVSKEGCFSIDLSHNYSFTQDLNEVNFGKKVTGKFFAWKMQNVLYSVMYFEYPEDANLEEMRKDAANGIRKTVKAHNGEILYEKPISLGDNGGLEIKYTANGITVISRNYLVGKIGYQVTGNYRDKSEEDSVLETLNSFKLIKDEK